MLDTCTLTVLVLMNSCRPISPLLRPWATRPSTSTSRAVSASWSAPLGRPAEPRPTAGPEGPDLGSSGPAPSGHRRLAGQLDLLARRVGLAAGAQHRGQPGPRPGDLEDVPELLERGDGGLPAGRPGRPRPGVSMPASQCSRPSSASDRASQAWPSMPCRPCSRPTSATARATAASSSPRATRSARSGRARPRPRRQLAEQQRAEPDPGLERRAVPHLADRRRPRRRAPPGRRPGRRRRHAGRSRPPPTGCATSASCRHWPCSSGRARAPRARRGRPRRRAGSASSAALASGGGDSPAVEDRRRTSSQSPAT